MRPTVSLPHPPLWRESRMALEAASLVRSGVWRGEGVADGRGQPVLLIPGFLAGDGSLSMLTHWLRRTGHHTGKAGIRLNVGCSGRSLDRLEGGLEELVERQGRPAVIIGQSRGGSFAKVLAQTRPDLVAGIVTLATPQLDPLAVHPLVRLQIEAVALGGSLRLPHLFSRSCMDGECCETFWQRFAAPLHPSIGYLAIFSRSDGIVDWRACLDPSAEHLEINSSHCGMGMNPGAYRGIADALGRFGHQETRARRSRPARLRAVA
ncbi:MAG: alpha/beta hydrolase [Actinomycetota bacterium]|nr:alpha/beta hydrolase [Actinomycetota bacterium]